MVVEKFEGKPKPLSVAQVLRAQNTRLKIKADMVQPANVSAESAILAHNRTQYALKAKKLRIPAPKIAGKGNSKAPLVHVHHALDIESYTICKESGEQAEFLICVKRINPTSSLDSAGMKYYYGIDCAVSFVFDYLLPLSDCPDNEMHHIWTYGGASFDWQLLMRPICYFFNVTVVGTRLSLKSIKIHSAIDTLDLWCWYQSSKYTLPSGKVCAGLAALAYMCDTPHKKTELGVPFESITRQMIQEDKDFRRNSCEYCGNDVEVLVDLVKVLVIKAYESFEFRGRKAFDPTQRKYPYSAASLALTVFKNCFMTEETILEGSSGDRLAKEHASYHGGLVLITKQEGKDVNCYDISSSYPTQMCKPMPVEYIKSVTLDSAIDGRTPLGIGMAACINDYDLYGVSKFSFPADCYLPCIAVAYKGHLITPSAWSSGLIYIWGCELKLALEMGAVVHITVAIKYKAGVVFKDFVDYFYNMKSTSKEAMFVLFYKLILNSLYGKFGQRPYNKSAYGNHDMFVLASLTPGGVVGCDGPESFNVKNIEDGMAMVEGTAGNVAARSKEVGSLVRFAACITAHGRCHLLRAAHSLKNMKENLIYGDTDSLYIANGDSPSVNWIGQGLGKFKLENKLPYSLMLVFGSKSYVCYNAANQIVSKRFKGARLVPDTAVNELAAGQSTSVQVKPFFVRSGATVKVTEITRTINITSDMKRVMDKDKDISRPYFDEHEFDTAIAIKEATRRLALSVSPDMASRMIDRTPSLGQLKKQLLEDLNKLVDASSKATKEEVLVTLRRTMKHTDPLKLEEWAQKLMALFTDGHISKDTAKAAVGQLALNTMQIEAINACLMSANTALEEIFGLKFKQ